MSALEQWRSIPDPYLFGYEISDRGNIRSPKGKVLKTHLSDGYPKFTLRRTRDFNRSFFVHRLVAQTFIPNPENKKTVNHIDGKRDNCLVHNLEWATQAENNNHARLTGACNTNGENNVTALLCNLAVMEIRSDYRHGLRGEAKRLSIKYRVSEQAIRDVAKGRTWKHI